MYDWKCDCGKIFETIESYEKETLKCTCGRWAIRLPSASSFVIKGYSAANGYSKEAK